MKYMCMETGRMEMKETNTKNEVGKKDKEVRKIPAFGGKGPSRIRQSFGRGLTIFLVIADRKSVV